MPHTDTITVTIEGYSARPQVYTLPKETGENLARFLAEGYLDDYSESIPAEIALPELYDPLRGPARVLRGFRYRAGLTQKQLAEKTGVRQHHLSEMENAKRPISKDMAQKLAKALGADYRVFL